MKYAVDGLADEIARDRLAVLFRLDHRGMLLESNEPGGPGEPPPLAFVSIGRNSCVFGIRGGLPESVAARLNQALALVRPVADLLDPAIEQRLRDSVRNIPLVTRVSSGPAFCFPQGFRWETDATLVDSSNSQILVPKDPDLVGRLSYVHPCYAVAVDGRAVSICHTSRVSGRYREAGVDTSGAFRLRGYGTAVVAGWARDVIAAGQIPLYSTDWGNRGSVGIATRLQLDLAAVDLEIE